MQTKVLLVGDDSYEMYAKAFYDAFLKRGYINVEFFAINHYLRANGQLKNLEVRIENRFATGAIIRKINNRLLKFVLQKKPDLIFLYSTRLIYAKTISKIKENGVTVFLYNNDDPFGQYYPKYFWRHYRHALKYADIGFVYRIKNVEEYRKCGCNRVEVLRAYYIENRNFYMERTKIKVPPVVFLGHNENDEREAYLRQLTREGITVGVTKRTWEKFEPHNPRIIKLENSHEYYNEMLNSAKIAVVFLSKINHDTYTRRCFEIPAVKTLMIAPYTEDIAAMFKENEEVLLFRNEREFVEKIKYYLNHEKERKQIAEAGYRRLMRDGHEVTDRIDFVMRCYDDLKRNQ